VELIVRSGEREERVHLVATANGYRVEIGDRGYDVDVVAGRTGLRSLLVGGRQHEVAVRPVGERQMRVTTASGAAVLEVMDPLTRLALESHGGKAATAGVVHALMPGRVVELLATEGESIEAGRGILVLEAMKMKNEIQAEAPGVLRRVFVEIGQAVEGGDPLFEIGAEPAVAAIESDGGAG